MENQAVSADFVQAFLPVPGANIYYETKGSGPLLLLISGAGGDHTVFNPVRDLLAANFRVATYDRRGYGKSALSGLQDYSQRINTDADDAASLIKYLSREQVFVFGTSSGGVVAQQLLVRHAELIRLLVSHEVPTFQALPDFARWAAFNEEVYSIYLYEGAAAAMQKFTAELIPGSEDAAPMKLHPQGTDLAYWFEHELRQYPGFNLDLEELRVRRDKLVFAVGSLSAGTLSSRPGTLLAERFGISLFTVTGGYLGYLLHPAEFAADLTICLQRTDSLL